MSGAQRCAGEGWATVTTSEWKVWLMGMGKCNECNESFKETAPRVSLAFALIGGASLTFSVGHFSHQTSKSSM